ncbi:MAG: GTPase [Thaumarchaeota archaeon]|nr:GTPase [Nitrososphaerota archaeon]MBT3744032.1 GTPase [Nitrososphaerota archaeon]MBT4056575.1 GTPase [Nitrososphaerota archaeon]MBT4175874.1 GTPase [Nitrososphaerota archaeon]MBT4510270.1 GTPase [Nitrososphaerota archaeon]
MKVIFVTGTAGAGKSLLTSKLKEYYAKNATFPITLNLDPGVASLPYSPDIDVRDYIDLNSLMEQYELGSNGSLIMANDLIATKIDDIQKEADTINPDYLIVDTPGQIELFAYRQSGPFFVNEFIAEEKMNLFLFDGTMVSTPENFVSLTLLSTSIRLRLGLPTVNVITKTDLIQEKLEKVLRWSGTDSQLEADLAGEVNGDTFSLISDMLSSLNRHDFQQDLIPVSNATGDGMVNLQSALSRTINLGEEIED